MEFLKKLREKLLSSNPSLTLQEAVRRGDLKEVRAHIRCELNLDGGGAGDAAALHIASGVASYQVGEKGRVPLNGSESAQLLIQGGADVNAPTPMTRRTPLHGFAEQGDVKAATMLIQHGANVNACDVDSRTPLHMAARWGSVGVAKLLLEHGADVNARVANGTTALKLAQMNKHDELARLLKQHGANGGGVNNVVSKALGKLGYDDLIKVSREGDLEKVSVILDAGADVNTKDGDGWTSLLYAANKGYTEIAAVLLDHGANVNVKCPMGWSPLYETARSGHTEMVALLLDRGAEVNIRDYANRTPLHAAVARGHEETAALLRQHGGVE